MTPKQRHTCKSCGRVRAPSDMGRLGADWYCHPARSWGNTCYMLADWALVAACASVGIEHGMSTAQMISEYLKGAE